MAEEPPRSVQLLDLISWSFLRSAGPVLVSFIIHMFALLFISIIVIHVGVGFPSTVFELSTVPDEPIDSNFQAIDSNEFDDPLLDSKSELNDPFLPEWDVQLLSDLQRADRSGGGSGTPSKRSSPEPPRESSLPEDSTTAEFFGTQVIGNDVVFILDRSHSMNTDFLRGTNNEGFTRFDVAKRELVEAVSALQSNQNFYVMLFSNEAEYMFGEQQPAAVPATLKNIRRLESWLQEEQARGGTNPVQSVRAALKLQPDSIFLLSDGEFDPGCFEDIMILIDKQNSANAKIHTVALDDLTVAGSLVGISKKTQGVFRQIKLKDYFIRTARKMPEVKKMKLLQLMKVNNLLSSINRIALATEVCIPLLASDNIKVRIATEEYLHEISFDLWKLEVPTVGHSDVTQLQLEHAQAKWKALWTNVVNYSSSRDSHKTTSEQAQLFLELIAYDGRGELKACRRVIQKDKSIIRQLGYARTLAKVAEASGASNDLRDLMDLLLGKLKNETTVKIERSFWKNQHARDIPRLQIKSLMRKRARLADKLSGQRLRVGPNTPQGKTLAARILNEFPETEAASALTIE